MATATGSASREEVFLSTFRTEKTPTMQTTLCDHAGSTALRAPRSVQTPSDVRDRLTLLGRLERAVAESRSRAVQVYVGYAVTTALFVIGISLAIYYHTDAGRSTMRPFHGVYYYINGMPVFVFLSLLLSYVATLFVVRKGFEGQWLRDHARLRQVAQELSSHFHNFRVMAFCRAEPHYHPGALAMPGRVKGHHIVRGFTITHLVQSSVNKAPIPNTKSDTKSEEVVIDFEEEGSSPWVQAGHRQVGADVAPEMQPLIRSESSSP